MTSGTTHRTLLDTVRRGPERFSESVAPIWQLHGLLILACGIGDQTNCLRIRVLVNLDD